MTVQSVDISHAKSSLSRLLEAIEQGRECEVVITRNGRPVAKLVRIDAAPVGKRIGVAKGLFDVPNGIDARNDEVAHLFLGRKPA